MTVDLVFKMLKVFLICLFGVIAVPNAYPAGLSERSQDERLPDAILNDLVSGPSRLADFRGKPLLINVWASWCGPCREEMSSLQRLAKRYDGKQINIIGISTDDDRAAALAYIKRSGIHFRNYIDRDLVLEKILRADRLPLTVMVDPDGRLIKRVYGARDWNSPEAINLITHAFRLNPN